MLPGGGLRGLFACPCAIHDIGSVGKSRVSLDALYIIILFMNLMDEFMIEEHSIVGPIYGRPLLLTKATLNMRNFLMQGQLV